MYKYTYLLSTLNLCCLSFSLLSSMENNQVKPMHSARALMLTELIPHLITTAQPDGVILPQWHESASPRKCRTIAKLEFGPHKGKTATIERSGWSEWGMDISSTCPISRLQAAMGSAFVLKFICETDEFDKEARSALYVGKIDGTTAIIPSCWLSHEDEINLFNFHRYELETLSDQLFPENAPARKILKEKIKNEKYYAHPSVFLHAVFLEAIKKNDAEILSDPTIVYNSFDIIAHSVLKNSKRKDTDLTDQQLRAKLIALWIEILTQRTDTYFSLLPKDIRIQLFFGRTL